MKNTAATTTTHELAAASGKLARELFRATHPELRIIEQREGARAGNFSRVWIFVCVAR
jgi:hypothetical protein